MRNFSFFRNKTEASILIVVFLLSNSTTLEASPETHQEVQHNADLQEVLRPRTSIDDRARGGFGDAVGILPIGDTEDWQRRASAAGLTDEGFYETGGRQNTEQFEKDLADINAQDADRLAEEEARQARYAIQDLRVFTDELERRERLAALDKESLNRKREQTSAATRRFVKRAEADGVWTDEEQAEYDRLFQEEMDAWELTAEEQDQIDRYTEIRNSVVDEIRNSAANMGGMSAEEVEERAQAANMADAATKTWRNITFTGRMINEVGKDITKQRELGIKANNTMIAAQLYMQRTDITDEQRKVAQEVYDAAHFARGAAADAIGKDVAVILLGTASDVAVLGVGRPVSIAAQKVGQGASNLWGRLFGTSTTTAAGETGAAAGAAVGAEASAAGRAAGAEASAGARATGTEAGAAGRSAAGEAGSAGEGAAGLKPSQMTPAQRQAYNDAKAQQAVSEGWRGNKPMQDGGAGVLPPPPGYVPPPAVGELSKGLTQAEINALFKPGANLTAEQIAQKADLLMTGFRPPVIGGPAQPLPGVVAGVADDAATVILPGQGAITGTAAEAGTVITGAGTRGAAGSATQAFDGAITLPGSGQAGSEAASGATTIIERGAAR